MDAVTEIATDAERRMIVQKIIVSRTDGEVMVTLLPHKDGSGWSFVNLTKGHICPCKFDSKKAGIKDLDSKPNVISYQMIEQKNQTNADRIRSMSDDELADFIYRCEMGDIDYAKTFCDLCNGQYECGQCRLDWLRQPMEVET